MKHWCSCLLVLALGGLLGRAGAVLPEEPKPKAKSAQPANAAASTAREIEAHEAAIERKRQSMETCLAGMAELRRVTAERCVLANGVCYDKSGCELQPDGRHRCTTVNAELTSRHEKAMVNSCRP